MVDNTVLNSGSGGDTIATDDIGGVKHQRVKVQVGADGSATDVSDANPMPVDDAGGSLTVDNAGTFAVQDDNALNLIDTNNSTTTPLGISGVFTGTGTDVSEYSAITIQLFADQASATDGMTFQFSTDNSNWDDVSSFTMTASDARRFQFPVTAQYFRVVYTNGGTGQGSFRVQTILHRQNVLTSIHRVVDDTSPDRSAQIVKSVLIAQAAGSGDFLNISSTAGGNLKVAVEEFDTSLPAGTNNIGDVDVLTIAAGSNLIGDVGIAVRTSGGTTLYKNIDLDESEDQIKGTAGQVYWIHAMNLASGKRFLKFYNATAASVTVGTTVPDLTFPLPTQGDTNGAGFTLSIPNGIAFGTAITIAATTGVADNDSGAPGANEVVVNLGYA